MKLTKALVLFAALASSAFGASVSFSMWDSTGAGTSTGTPLTSTYTAYIGRYTGLANQSSTYADIASGFTVLGSAAFSTTTGDENGFVDMGSLVFSDAGGYAGTQVYIWFSNGSTQNALITGFGTFPADGDIPNSKAFGIDNSNAATLTYITGTYDAGIQTIYGGGTIKLNNTAPVPEPSAALLGVIGALGLLRRRRN